MAIKQSVGNQGINDSTDTKVIQAALNLAQSTGFSLTARLMVDGDAGAKTTAAIEDFQQAIVGMQSPDGRVDPNGRTLASLKRELVKGLSEDALLAIMAKGDARTIQTYHPLMNTALPKYQVNTPLRQAHFLAQVGHESLSLNYTAELASGAAYEGRTDLGNTREGDGVRFKGRGLIQLTGRDNYARYGAYAGLDLLEKGNEVLIADEPRYALDVSLWFWDSRHLNTLADADDLKGITRRVNGGYNGLADRRDYLDRAKFFLLP